MNDFVSKVLERESNSRYTARVGPFPSVLSTRPTLHLLNIVILAALVSSKSQIFISSVIGTFRDLTSLRSNNTKVLITLGGWGEGTEKYSRLARNETSRRNFIQHAIKYLKENKFDGLDLDWSYPKCWRNDCEAGTIVHV